MHKEDTMADEPCLTFNERLVPCPYGMTLAELLKSQGVEGYAVTTAVNGMFVPRTRREHMDLVPGDRVLTFQPIVGG